MYLVAVALAGYLLFDAVITFQVIQHYHDQEQSEIFWRAIYVLSAGYGLLAISVILFLFRRVAAIALAISTLALVFTNTWVATGLFKYVFGWFSVVPVLLIAVYLIERRLLRSHRQ